MPSKPIRSRIGAQEPIVVTEPDGGAIIRWVGEIDVTNSDRVSEAVRSALHSDPARLVLDLSGVTFLDSCGIKSVLLAETWCQERGVDFELIPSGFVQRVVELINRSLPTAHA